MTDATNKIYDYLQMHGQTVDMTCQSDLGLREDVFNAAVSELESSGRIFVDNKIGRAHI